MIKIEAVIKKLIAIIKNKKFVIPKDVKVGKAIDITGCVTDNDGKPLVNIFVKVKVNGKTFSVKTEPMVNGF